MITYLEQCPSHRVIKDDTGYGNALAIKDHWSARFLPIIKAHKIKVIRLNQYTGWPDADISFLAEIPGLVGVDILSDSVTDVSPLFRVKTLRSVSLFCKARKAGDFASLGALENVGLAWRPAYESVFGLQNLVELTVTDYPLENLKRWGTNDRLKRLRLESRRLKSLSGIQTFPAVRSVSLHRCARLESLANMPEEVQELKLERCPGIKDLRTVASLKRLKILEIVDCGEIVSVAPLAKCLQLERLQIAGNTTVVDGNLRSLLSLPNLKSVRLKQRRHYSHRAEELEKRDESGGSVDRQR